MCVTSVYPQCTSPLVTKVALGKLNGTHNKAPNRSLGKGQVEGRKGQGGAIRVWERVSMNCMHEVVKELTY